MPTFTFFQKGAVLLHFFIFIRITSGNAIDNGRMVDSPSYESIGRYLRGGSYSGGSWSGKSTSSSSGGWNRNRNSSNNSSNYNRNNGRGMSTMGKVFTGLAVAGVGLLALAVLFPAIGVGVAACCPLLAAACCCGGVAVAAGAAASNNNDYKNADQTNDCYAQNPAGLNRNDNAFEQHVQEAKREVENSSAGAFQNQYHNQMQPFSGQYTLSFMDPESGVMHNASISIFFTPDNRGLGFKLNGQGSDVDGSTVIEDGHVNHDGLSWWRERNITGDVGLQVLSRGRFNFQNRTFQGTWLASTMLNGPYYSFSAITNNGITQSVPSSVGNPTVGPEWQANNYQGENIPVFSPDGQANNNKLYHTNGVGTSAFNPNGQASNMPIVTGTCVQSTATTLPSQSGYVSPIVIVSGQPV